MERTSKRGPQWEGYTALAMAKRTGVTEACFCIVTEGQPLRGESSREPARSAKGSRLPAREGAVRCQLVGGSVAVTEQRDENQGGGCSKD